MPLIFKKNIAPDISVCVWQIAENEEYFSNSLHLLPEDEMKIKSISLQKVRLQKLACRAALSYLSGTTEIHITYSETGQPLFTDHFISFSHTKNYVAVALAKIPAGIDMEELTPRILPLYPRFMSEKEITECNVNNLKDLYYYWCAKEAIYKWMATKNLDFIEDIEVIKSEKKGAVCKKHTVQITDFYFDNHIVVVCY